MRLVMMGTGGFAVPTLRALLDSSHDVVALFTQPQRTKRGRRSPPQNPARQQAEQRGTTIFDPESVNTPDARDQLARLEPELLVIADFGQILRGPTLAVPPQGAINLHGSLLPRYRGAAPVNWAIYHGETETGVTVFRLTPSVDAGPSLAQARLAIDPDETAVELESRLAFLGAPLVCRVVDDLETGTAAPQPQDASLASRAPRLKKQDGAIDWSRPARAIKDHVRSMEPWPKTFSFWHPVGKEPLRFILGEIVVHQVEAAVATGTVVAADDDVLQVATGDGVVEILGIQPAGKRMLTAAEFLRGYGLRPGDRLGSAP